MREGGRTVWLNHRLRELLPELHSRMMAAAVAADARREEAALKGAFARAERKALKAAKAECNHAKAEWKALKEGSNPKPLVKAAKARFQELKAGYEAMRAAASLAPVAADDLQQRVRRRRRHAQLRARRGK